MPELVFISLFIIIFGIFYLHYSTRNKERLALIDKGADASIFFTAKAQRKNQIPIWKVLILNLATLLMGIGAGVFIGSILAAYTQINNDAGYTGSIFLMAGLGLLVGFSQSKKLVEKV